MQPHKVKKLMHSYRNNQLGEEEPHRMKKTLAVVYWQLQSLISRLYKDLKKQTNKQKQKNKSPLKIRL